MRKRKGGRERERERERRERARGGREEKRIGGKIEILIMHLNWFKLNRQREENK